MFLVRVQYNSKNWKRISTTFSQRMDKPSRDDETTERSPISNIGERSSFGDLLGYGLTGSDLRKTGLKIISKLSVENSLIRGRHGV